MSADPNMQPAASEAPITAAGMMLGLRKVSVLMPGIVVFAVAFGAAASAKGLSLFETLLMSGFVYAGVAQLVSLELWRPEWTWGAIAGIAVVTATVNARMVLQGASLQPWFAKYPKTLNAFHLFFFTDANWLIGTRYRARAGAISACSSAQVWRSGWSGSSRRVAATCSARWSAILAATASTSSCRSSLPR